jgi:class 3 adenylate cyclase
MLTSTLVLHQTDDALAPVERARCLAERIAGGRLVELPAIGHVVCVGDSDLVLSKIGEFFAGARHHTEPDRVLATVLFTDIVGSTERVAQVGDRRWRELLGAYYALARRQLERFRGREVDTAGDGLFAAFDVPARAIRCAAAIRDGVRSIGLECRAAVHTGECEQIGGKIGGIAVHIGARVAAMTGPGDVLVTSTVKDLVAGSGVKFEDRGTRSLKGVPGEWHLYAVTSV